MDYSSTLATKYNSNRNFSNSNFLQWADLRCFRFHDSPGMGFRYLYYCPCLRTWFMSLGNIWLSLFGKFNTFLLTWVRKKVKLRYRILLYKFHKKWSLRCISDCRKKKKETKDFGLNKLVRLPSDISLLGVNAPIYCKWCAQVIQTDCWS